MALNLSALEKDIQACFEDTLPTAFEQAFKAFLPQESKDGNTKAKKCGEIFTNLVAESWAKRLASAIDYYIKSGAIKGTLITVGSPSTHTCTISPINLGNPTAGSVPNTLGIV